MQNYIDSKIRILIIEDETALADVLRDRLEEENFEVLLAQDGEEGYEMAVKQDFSVIILDGMLPKIDGFEVMRYLRTEGISTPIVMLTARADVLYRIRGLDMGADDYITKPFSMEELIARIRNVLLRVQKEQKIKNNIKTEQDGEKYD